MLLLIARHSPLTKLCICIALAAAAPAGAQLVTLELIPLPQPSDFDESATLPTPVTTYEWGATIFVELWAQTFHPDGLATVAADLTYSSRFRVVAIRHTELFDESPSGTNHAAIRRIDNLGGTHSPTSGCEDQIGFGPTWVRVAIVELRAVVPTSSFIYTWEAGSSIYATTLCGGGAVAPSDIAFGRTQFDVTRVQCQESADCDDGNPCNGEEYCRGSSDPYCSLRPLCPADQVCDCNNNELLDECDIAAGTSADDNGDGVPDECRLCETGETCLDDDVCTSDHCMDGICIRQQKEMVADVTAYGSCGADGQVDIFDILLVLDAFEGRSATGCPLANFDIVGPGQSCEPDGRNDIFDILAVLDGFQGLFYCVCK